MTTRDKTVTVPHRIYSEPDKFGHKRLLYAAGEKVDWETAVELRLVEGKDMPEDQQPFSLPRDVYEEHDGERRLVHRAGRVVTVAEARRLGQLEAKETAGDEASGSAPDETGDAGAASEGDADAAGEESSDADSTGGPARGGRRRAQES